ncbi:hypothetical protein FQA47_010652 [Oryzias melastigma]|uniref:Uncharacterized protein n=1 Tax=Oryzias melastigma TaxID=30732 RepID=A0A834F216_ORYME|nr:hypothetical protein FQA47_010652 [Oryzias melastigma]
MEAGMYLHPKSVQRMFSTLSPVVVGHVMMVMMMVSARGWVFAGKAFLFDVMFCPSHEFSMQAGRSVRSS